jgi:hypothetical protein
MIWVKETILHIQIIQLLRHLHPDPAKHINIGRNISVVCIYIEFERVFGIDYFGAIIEELPLGELSCKLWDSGFVSLE